MKLATGPVQRKVRNRCDVRLAEEQDKYVTSRDSFPSPEPAALAAATEKLSGTFVEVAVEKAGSSERRCSR